MTPDERGSTGPGRLPTPRQALVFLVGIALLFISGGVFLLLLGFGEAGIFLAQWLFLFLPAVVFVRLGGFDVRETLSLRMPGRRQLAGAVLVMAGGTPIAWFLAWLQSFIIPVPVEFAEEMARLLVTDDPFRLLWLLVLIALTPAICEEFVFRGVVLGGMRGRFSPARLIVLNGIIFGIFHLSFQTVFRFLPTAWLGVVIAGVVWKTRSIWTGVLMHFLNNGVIVLLVASPLLRVRFEHLSEAPPLLILPVAILLLATGVRILQEHQPEGTTS